MTTPDAVLGGDEWQDYYVNGVVWGGTTDGTLILNGGGGCNRERIELNAANTYTGGTIVNDGIITYLNSTGFGAAAGGVTTFGRAIFLPTRLPD